MTSAAASGLTEVPRDAGRLRRFWDSTIGKKVVMAITGILGLGFLVVHMVGNLQMFKPTGAAQAMHDYAVGLRALGPLLWIARGGLVVLVVLHVIAAAQLTRRNRLARPADYERRALQASTWGARSMRVGGVVLAAFIGFHLADMTWGWGHPSFVHLDPYNNLRVGFQRWWAVLFYLVALGALGLHLYHGAWASWRTLGARRPSAQPMRRTIAVAFALVIAVGFAAVPIAAALGFFRDAPVGPPALTLRASP